MANAERLDRERVIKAAVELLDSDGLDALSTRRLGTVLNSSPNVMYWHVGSMENLVGLATDQVFAELTLAIEGASWRDDLAQTARDLRLLFSRHPWLTEAFSTHPRIHGPAIVRFQNHLLQVCSRAGFEGFDLDWAGASVFTQVLGDAWGRTPSPMPKDRTTTPTEIVEQVRGDLADYPLLLERYEALANADPGTVDEASFEFGLTVLLDGLQARLNQRPPAP
ncbi:TetR/AcrR family transcriptional regulator C-terminal domain-containing protein [Amycolatopsis ultiminotia]|uniref:TetR/AcrR family transcriptional regulator C-terminal domain-containing protein n=1 Tax=Amycolatopsis ultiminotia TaxID=543629 RepID=A0ABP6XP10_9PSEU